MLVPMNRRPAAAALLAFSMATAAAANDRPADYAQAIPLTVSGKQAIVQLALPRAVYLSARTADLRDLRVFDAAGASMPFALTAPAAQDGQRSTQAPAAVFPVRAPAASTQRLQDRLQIRTGSDGAVISVTAPAAGGGDDVLAGLVLDLQPAGAPAKRANVTALSLTLPPGVNSYSAQLVLETSDDLQDWEEAARATVSWLVNSQGASVRQDRIAFAPLAFRYARLRWLDGKPVEFAGVTAHYVEQVSAPRQRDSLVLKPAGNAGGQDLVYAAPVGIPVEAIGLQFHAQNVVLPALIGQYRKVRAGDGNLVDQLQPVVNTTFYRMTQNGQERASGDVDLPLTHAAQWVVRPQAAVTDRPDLRLRWSAATMVFLAGGKGPYTLAVGRDGVASTQVPLAQVAPGFTARELAALEQARAGEPIQQHAPGAGPLDAEREAAQRRSIWLWTLLVCGVAALAAMAWRLSRQLKDAPPESAPD